MFQTLIYPSSGACDYSVELLHWSYCSWFNVCWSFGVVGLEWYPCCRRQQLHLLRESVTSTEFPTELNGNVFGLLNYGSVSVYLRIVDNFLQSTWYNDLRENKMTLKSHIHSVQKWMVEFWESVS